MARFDVVVFLLVCLVVVVRSEMIDSLSTVPMLAPVNCTNGCALWSDLAKDGNKHNQSEVDAKWLKGSAPAEAQSRCAMPSKDPGTDTYWCYCKDPNPTLLDWGYCQSPTKPVPEQINLQVPEFVTFFLKGGRFNVRAVAVGQCELTILRKAAWIVSPCGCVFVGYCV